MNIQNKEKKLSLKFKLKILFTDYLLIIGLISFFNIIFPHLDKNHPWFFWLCMYFIYYTCPEFFFKRTLGMRLWNVFIYNTRNSGFNKKFLIYSIVVILDRFVFSIFYLASAIHMFDNKLFLSEKISGLRWRKCNLK